MVRSGKHSLVPVHEIELDRSNPRIRKYLEMYGGQPSPEQIFLALAPETTTQGARPARRSKS
jgi:hypothetical protein